MSFIDNPVISAIGNQLGLGGVFDAARAGVDPTAPTTDPQQGGPPVKALASKPNIPLYKERPYIPRAEGTLPKSGGVSPGQGGNPITPGGMDPATLQSPQVQALLGQYGVTPSTAAPDPNLFIHNPDAFQNHPVLSGMLERGMEGLAYAHPGQNFFQSLIGGAQGIQQANAARGAQVNAQTMAPVQQAAAIQALQHGSDEHNAALDAIQYHKDMIQHYHSADSTRAERLAQVPPHYNPKTGQPSYLQEDEDGNPKWVPDSSWSANPHDAMISQYYQAKKDQLTQKYGSLDAVPPQELMGVLTGIESGESLAKGAASIQNTKTKAATSIQNANTRAAAGGAGAGRITPQQKVQLQQLNQQDAALGRTINSVTNAHDLMTDENGKLVAPTTPAHQAYLGRLQQRQRQIQQQKSAITGLSGAATSNVQIPDGADGAWDPVTKTVVHRSQ